MYRIQIANMGNCSYAWEELNEEKTDLIEKQCKKNTWNGSEQYCIFHDPSKEKDIDLFREKLQEKLDSLDYDFRGFFFPEDVNFSSKKFEEDVCFDGATFQMKANFNKTIFKNVDFNGVIFRENTFFVGTIFHYVSFIGAIIERSIEFAPKEIKQLNLQNSKFLLRGRITTDLRQAKFCQADLENVVFLDCHWPERVYEEMHMGDERLSYSEVETIYRNLKQNMQRHGDYAKAGEFYYREMEMRRKQYKLFSPRWWGQNTLRILCGYGEKPIRVIGISLLIIFIGAILFFFCGVARVGTELPPEKNPYIIDYSLGSTYLSEKTAVDFGYCVYYSVVTFTTLGYGDIHPLGCSNFFASVEAFIGVFFMALFVLVFGRKMMR